MVSPRNIHNCFQMQQYEEILFSNEVKQHEHSPAKGSFLVKADFSFLLLLVWGQALGYCQVLVTVFIVTHAI